MKNHQSGFIIPVLILIVAAIVIGGSAYVYTKNKSDHTVSVSTSTSTQTTSVAKSATTASSSATNWKVYTNNENHFSIKYPLAGGVTDRGIDSSGSHIFVVGLQSNSVPVDREVYIKLKAVSQSNDCNINFNGVSTATVTIKGIKFTKGDVTGQYGAMSSGAFATEYCVIQNNMTYRLIALKHSPGPMTETSSGSAVPSPSSYENGPILDAVINSFTITPTNPVNISKWKTYIDSRSGLQISYPYNWVVAQSPIGIGTVFCPPELADTSANGTGCKVGSTNGGSVKSLAPIDLFITLGAIFDPSPGPGSTNAVWFDSNKYVYLLQVSDPTYQDTYAEMQASIKAPK